MPSLQVVSIVVSILCPILTALIMWGYRSDQKRIMQIIEKNTENIVKNADAIEKTATRHTERMDRIEANFNDLKADLPFVYVLREDFVRSLNNVDMRMTDISGKLDKLIEKV